MVEPVTTATTVGLGAVAAYLSKDGISKLLGPTAEYLGNGLKDFTQKRIENVGKIFKNAEEKLGDKIYGGGQVPPKVLKRIIDEGSYCDDELSAEYFGGVLASSRTTVSRDDRAARIIKIVDGLSTYQVRMHYYIYSCIRHLFIGKGYHFNMNDRQKMEIFIPIDSYLKTMQFVDEEMSQFQQIMSHSLWGLSKENLIENFQFGSEEDMKKKSSLIASSGITCTPSALGAELFLWAHGHADKSFNYIISAEELPMVEGHGLYFDGCINLGE